MLRVIRSVVCGWVCVCLRKTSIYTITSQDTSALARDVCYMSRTECYSPHYCLCSCCFPGCPKLFQNKKTCLIVTAHSLVQKTQKSQPQCDNIQYIGIAVLNSVQSSPLTLLSTHRVCVLWNSSRLLQLICIRC